MSNEKQKTGVKDNWKTGRNKGYPLQNKNLKIILTLNELPMQRMGMVDHAARTHCLEFPPMDGWKN